MLKRQLGHINLNPKRYDQDTANVQSAIFSIMQFPLYNLNIRSEVNERSCGNDVRMILVK